MRKTIPCLLVITLLLALAACRVTVEKQFCPVVSETLSNAAAHIEEQPEFIAVALYRNGENCTDKLVSEAQREIVTDAVMDYMLRSAAWPGVDVGARDMYIHIYEKSADGEVTEYYVFEQDGQHCMQAAKDGMYSIISNEVYRPLYELAMGWYTPLTMTVVSGGESIYAIRNWIWTDGSDGVCADGFRMTPQEAEPMVEYVTYAEDFSPYIDGEMKPGIGFKLYDEYFEQVEYFIPSDREAWAETGKAGPGKYIAAAEYIFEDEEGSSGYQYFFGLIVPESKK